MNRRRCAILTILFPAALERTMPHPGMSMATTGGGVNVMAAPVEEGILDNSLLVF